MGCLFGCFRVAGDGGERRGGHDQLVSSSVLPNPKIGAVKRPPSKNALSAVFLREDEASLEEQVASSQSSESDERKKLNQELKHEASLLENCGVLLETPNEIRKAPENMNSDYQNATHSACLPVVSGKLHFMEGQDVEDCQTTSGPHQSSSLPGVGSSTCKGCEVSSQHDSDAVSKHQDVEGVNNESVIDSGTLLTALDSCSFKIKDDNVCLVGSKSSPPSQTPSKVNDEMQTPVTAHPATLENLSDEKNARTCVQLVYPALNPFEDFEHDQSEANFQRKKNANLVAVVETSISDECSLFQSSEGSISSSNKIREGRNAASAEKSLTSESTVDAISKKASKNHDSDAQVPSLSQWLKPPNPKKVFRPEVFTNDKSHSGKSSEHERPIIGMVAAHWKDKVSENISPKWWDGNGIPNSTNKYKEDQKVSWHATPFEERLEKALSDEKLLSQSRTCSSGKTSEFSGMEGEETDTAASTCLRLTAFA